MVPERYCLARRKPLIPKHCTICQVAEHASSIYPAVSLSSLLQVPSNTIYSRAGSAVHAMNELSLPLYTERKAGSRPRQECLDSWQLKWSRSWRVSGTGKATPGFAIVNTQFHGHPFGLLHFSAEWEDYPRRWASCSYGWSYEVNLSPQNSSLLMRGSDCSHFHSEMACQGR